MSYPPPPYADAVCGGFVCGEALAGTWWAYPPTDQMLLAGIPPTLVILEAEAVPQAKLLLVGIIPDTVVETELQIPQGTLALAGVIPSYQIDSTIEVTLAELLLVAYIATFVGISRIYPADCIPIDLQPALESELELVASACTDIDLQPAEVVY